jgi:hypothetical protein
VKEKRITGPEGEIAYSDPRMVAVGLSRRTYGSIEGISLFGSSVKNQSVISLRISQAELTRSLSSDCIHGDIKPIIEVLLTPLQLSELITGMNIGTGVPATLIQHNGERFDIPEFPSYADQFGDEIKEGLESVVSRMREAEKDITDLIDDPKPIGKTGRKNLRDMIVSYRNYIEGCIPFVISIFANQTNRAVEEAKAEVESFVQETIIKTGITELMKRFPKIKNKTEDK